MVEEEMGAGERLRRVMAADLRLDGRRVYGDR